MTKKHFEWFAEWIAANENLTGTQIRELGEYFKTTNDKFDVLRFEQAIIKHRAAKDKSNHGIL